MIAFNGKEARQKTIDTSTKMLPYSIVWQQIIFAIEKSEFMCVVQFENESSLHDAWTFFKQIGGYNFTVNHEEKKLTVCW